MPSSIRNGDAVTGYRQLSNIARVSVALISAVDPYPTDAGKKVVLAGFVSYFAERYGPGNVHYIKVGAAPDHEFPVRLHVVPAPSRATVMRNIATKVSTGRASLQEAFLGSPKTAAEIRRIIDEQYAVSTKILKDNADKVEAMTAALMEYETIDADQIADIMAGRPVRAVKTYNTPGSGGGDSSAGTAVSTEGASKEGKADATSPAAASSEAASDTP